ncbi:MAG TPA: hypothetical protein VGA84_16930, partial [Thermoanaerobaculia bacterium]
RDGQILEGPRKVFDGLAYYLASNGSRILTFTRTEGVILNGHAEVIRRFPMPDFSKTYTTSSLVSNGSTFLLVMFKNEAGTYSATLTELDANGQTAGETRINARAANSPVLVKSDGDGYIVLYQDATGSGYTALSVSAHGTLRATSKPDLHQSLFSAALSWAGQGYVLASVGSVQVAVTSLDGAGATTGSARLLASGVASYDLPALAANGSETLVAWTSASPEGPGRTIHAALVGADSTSRSPVLTVPSASNGQAGPVMATGGAYDLAVWEETTGIYATRVTSSGEALDGRGILVYAQKAPTIGSIKNLGTFRPRVIFDGTVYLVAWGPDNVKGQRIDPRSGLLLGAPITLASCAHSFDLVVDGTSPVVFVAGCDPSLYAQRVDAFGPVGARFPIVFTDPSLSQPRAAWNGHQWLVVWQDSVGGISVYLNRLSSAFDVLDMYPIAFPVPPFVEQTPSVTSNGNDFAVVWTHYYYYSGGPSAIDFRNIHSDGTAGQSTTLVSNARVSTALVWDGSQYAVAYAEKCPTTPCLARSYLIHFDVQDDQPVLRDKMQIADSPVVDASLTVSANGRERILYTRQALEPLYGGSPRAFLRDYAVEVPRRRAVGRR